MWRLSAVHQGPKSNRMEQQLVSVAMAAHPRLTQAHVGKALDVEFRQYSLRTLMDQDVLLQEDVELIELLDPSVLSTRSSSSRATVSLPGNRFLTPSIWYCPAPPCLVPVSVCRCLPCILPCLPACRLISTLSVPHSLDVSGLVAFVAVLAGLRSVAEGPGLAVLVPWALALAGFLLVRGAGLWKAAQLGATMRARGAQLERLALDSRALTGLIRKSLRLIQETEVISRGFTLGYLRQRKDGSLPEHSGRVSAACPLNKAGGQQRGQQLLGLRKASYRALHSAFRASRLATCHMLKSYPSAPTPEPTSPSPLPPLGTMATAAGNRVAPAQPGQTRAESREGTSLNLQHPSSPLLLYHFSSSLSLSIDNVTNYLSTVPLKELGLGLGEVHLTDEQAQELTDDYSLPALKVCTFQGNFLYEGVRGNLHCATKQLSFQIYTAPTPRSQVTRPVVLGACLGAVLFQLWVGQSSEFYRRLALLLSPGREESRQGRGNSEKQWRDFRLMHQVVAEVTGPLHHTLSSCLGELQRSYDFHRYFETQRQSQGSDRASRARQKCHELNILHTSVRSLQLHLKALLNEVIILEDELEKLMVSGETVETVGVEDLQDRLRLLQPHMQASCGCWEDTCAQVDRMLHRVTNCPAHQAVGIFSFVLKEIKLPGCREGTGFTSRIIPAVIGACVDRCDESVSVLLKRESGKTPGTPEDKTPSLPPPQPCPVTLIHNRDPVPEEQELEAYVSDSDSDTEWRGVLLDLLSPEERERHRQEKEESRRVLLELKGVLGLRASEMEREKWKQMLFSDQAAVRPEGTEPHTTQIPSKPSNQQSNHVASPPGEVEGSTIPLTKTQLSCGHSEGGKDDTHPPDPVNVEEALLCHCDRPAGEGSEENGTECPPVARVPTVSATDRLTELHGSAAFGFNSALAAQVAARSHSFTKMEEKTYGDEEGDVTSQS
ncbi:hypothetical protein JZ751_016855 [Albula glossodonta]|uniref:Vezatin n=1 Tax=Albula glossodonta TaxID=121402 RepID=A0A8T2NNE6_9TELE|nr:hypothetical protein JZ751_016855 [Albula glossodonta]